MPLRVRLERGGQDRVELRVTDDAESSGNRWCSRIPRDRSRAARWTDTRLTIIFWNWAICDRVPSRKHAHQWRHAVGGSRNELQTGHQECTIAGQGDDITSGVGEAGADGGRHRVAHAREVGRRQKPSRRLEAQVLHGEEGAVAAVGGEDRILTAMFAGGFEEGVRMSPGVAGSRRSPAPQRPRRARRQFSRPSSPRAEFPSIKLSRELRQRTSRLHCDGELGRKIAVEDLRFDINVDQAPRVARSRSHSGSHLSKTAADGQQAVTAVHGATVRMTRRRARPKPGHSQRGCRSPGKRPCR